MLGMKHRMIAVALSMLALAGCNVRRVYSQEVLLADGSTVRAQMDLVVAPDEFLQPGHGPTRKLKVTFFLPGRNIVWPGVAPDGDATARPEFPFSFQMWGKVPVVVVERVGGTRSSCDFYGHPPSLFVAYAFDGKVWYRIPPENSLPSFWRANMVGDIRNPHNGSTLSFDEVSAMVTADFAEPHQPRPSLPPPAHLPEVSMPAGVSEETAQTLRELEDYRRGQAEELERQRRERSITLAHELVRVREVVRSVEACFPPEPDTHNAD
jgi:hypothetical protein